MNFRQRIVLATMWVTVAVLIALTLESAVPTTVGEGARLLVIALALLLAGVYLTDPWELITRTHPDPGPDAVEE